MPCVYYKNNFQLSEELFLTLFSYSFDFCMNNYLAAFNLLIATQTTVHIRTTMQELWVKWFTKHLADKYRHENKKLVGDDAGRGAVRTKEGTSQDSSTDEEEDKGDLDSKGRRSRKPVHHERSPGR